MTTRNITQTVLIQVLQDRLDSEQGRMLQKQVAEISHEPSKIWVIDMSQVDFIDSSGLFALVATLKEARKRHCRLALCNIRQTVRLIFEITQLERVFEIHESYEALQERLTLLETIPENQPTLIAA